MFRTSNDVATDCVELSETDRHRLLADPRRRAAWEVLTDEDLPASLSDVAAAVAARDDAPITPVAGRRSDVAIELHHVHLPKLAECGVLEYDPSSNVVSACRLGIDDVTA